MLQNNPGAVYTWHIAAPDVCDGTSAVGESRHRIPGASVGQPTEDHGSPAKALAGSSPKPPSGRLALPWTLPWPGPRNADRAIAGISGKQRPHPWHSRAGGGRVHSINSDSCSAAKSILFNHLVGAWRAVDAGTVRPSTLAVLRLMTSSNLVGCITGRSAGFYALENLGRCRRRLWRYCVNNAGAVAHQAAGCGELAPIIDRRHRMARRQRDELFAPVDEKGICRHLRAARQPAALTSVAKAVSKSRSVPALHDADLSSQWYGPQPARLDRDGAGILDRSD